MDDLVPFGSRDYLFLLAIMVFSRAMDFLSTWVATPNLLLEGNPLARKLGWKWGILVNGALCAGFSVWPVPAITVSTTSLLVAARNFQSAWLMRTLGEEDYRHWHVDRIHETSAFVYLACLAGNTLLTAAVGVAVVLFSGMFLVPFAIGLGIVAYALAVGFYTTLAWWRIRRSRSVMPIPPAAADTGMYAPD